MKTKLNVDYSIVIPVYNSEKTIVELFDRIKSVFDQLDKSFEVVFVEDCGTDNSWNVIKNLKNKFPEYVTAIRLSKNFGQHNAIMCGFNHVKGQTIITIDDDLQIPPEEIFKLVAYHQNYLKIELIYGVFEQKKHSASRNAGSWIVQRIFQYVFKTSGHITSFRLITRSLVDKIRRHKQSFIFIDGLFHWYSSHIDRVETNHNQRQVGKSGYTITKLIRLAANLLFNFTTLPLRLVVYLGFFISLASLIVGFLFVLRKTIYDVPVGYTSIIVTLFFMGGIILLVLGVIGEYISRLYSLQNSKPQYSVEERI